LISEKRQLNWELFLFLEFVEVDETVVGEIKQLEVIRCKEDVANV
jgi:hypothetical protein